MTNIFLGFFLGGIIGAAISNVLTNHYCENEIDKWRLTYHKCRGELTRVYRQKDELAQKLKDKEAK